MQQPAADFHLLDLLVDGPSSFAALHQAIRRFWASSDMAVSDTFGIVKRLEGRGLIRVGFLDTEGGLRALNDSEWDSAQSSYLACLTQAKATDVAVDPIGLWIKVTEDGRSAWSKWSLSQGAEMDRWRLDDRETEESIEIRANNASVAERVLTEWLVDHPDRTELPGTRSLGASDAFCLHDGSTVVDGVALTCRYRRRRPSET